MNWLVISVIQLLFTLILYGFGIIVIGLSIFPGVLLCFKIWHSVSHLAWTWKALFLSFGIITGYFLYGLCLIFVVGMFRWVFRLNLKEGEYPMHSVGALKWMLVNSLVQAVSNTFMDFILLTPFLNIFYRFMGVKLGKNVQINSKFCADLSLLEIGDRAVIGGHATVIAHSFERGRLILKKVKIGKNAVIGLNSVVLPGADIGDNAILAAGAVLNKNAVVEPRSVYLGVPAVSAKSRHSNVPD